MFFCYLPKKKKIIQVTEKPARRWTNDHRIFLFGLIAQKNTLNLKAYVPQSFVWKKNCSKSHILMHKTRSIFLSAFSDMSPESCIILFFFMIGQRSSSQVSWLCVHSDFSMSKSLIPIQPLSLSAVCSTILKLAPNLAPWLQFSVFNTQRAMLPSPTHYQHYWFLCCVICLRPKLCGQKMKSRNITNLGVEIWFLCVFILFVFAPFLQPHSLTFLFMMSLV